MALSINKRHLKAQALMVSQRLSASTSDTVWQSETAKQEGENLEYPKRTLITLQKTQEIRRIPKSTADFYPFTLITTHPRKTNVSQRI